MPISFHKETAVHTTIKNKMGKKYNNFDLKYQGSAGYLYKSLQGPQ